MSRILISGGAGFLGRRLARRLVASGEEVVILDSFSAQVHGHADPPEALSELAESCEVQRGDVRDRQAWARALEGADAVVHLAAETGVEQSMRETERYLAVNVLGTALLLEEVARASGRPRRLVLASSRAVYGEGRYLCGHHGISHPGPRLEKDLARGLFELACPLCGEAMQPLPCLEDQPLAPASVYGMTKRCQEELLFLSARTSGIPSIALRFQNVYGPGQSLLNPHAGLLPAFAVALLGGRAIEVLEDGRESRDFIHVDDAVEAIVLALEPGAPAGMAVNIGTGRSTPLLHAAEALCKALGLASEIRVSGQYRPGDIRHGLADTERAEGLLGFRARIEFEAGLRDFADWAVHRQGRTDPHG